MDEDRTSTQEILVKLRHRMLDLQKTGMMTQESFGTYQQTILQIWQEAERRKQTCFSQAETLRRQAAAADAQAHAFSAMASIMYAVVDGYVKLEEKRIREIEERKQEKEAAAEAESGETTAKAKPKGKLKK